MEAYLKSYASSLKSNPFAKGSCSQKTAKNLFKGVCLQNIAGCRQLGQQGTPSHKKFFKDLDHSLRSPIEGQFLVSPSITSLVNRISRMRRFGSCSLTSCPLLSSTRVFLISKSFYLEILLTLGNKEVRALKISVYVHSVSHFTFMLV